MSSITKASSYTGAATTNRSVTARQDAAQQEISSASQRLNARRAAAQSAEAAAGAAQDWFSKLSKKDQAKPENIQRLQNLQRAAEEAKQQVKAAEQELLRATNALPAAIAADQQQTNQNNARAEKQNETQKTQKENAESNKEASKEAAKSEAAATATKGPAKKAENKAADLVGSAAAGDAEAAPEASEAGAPVETAAPQGDGYVPTPSRGTARPAVKQYSVLPDEKAEQAHIAADKSGGARAEGGVKAPESRSLSLGTAEAMADTDETDATETAQPLGYTNPEAAYDKLTPAQKAKVTEVYQMVREAAREGDVKRTEAAFREGMANALGTSAIASDDEEGTKGSKAQKPAQKKNVGSSASGAKTPAGNAALSSQVGATGASSAEPRMVSNLVGASGQGTGKLANQVGAASSGAADIADEDNLYAPIELTANSEIGKAYSGGMSPMQLVQMVMLKAFQEAGEDVRGAANVMQKQTNAKQDARAEQNSLRSQVVYDKKTGGQDSASKAASDKLSSIDGNIDAIGDDNQVTMIRLQNLTQLMTTMSQAASNISKSAYDTTKSVVGQIGR